MLRTPNIKNSFEYRVEEGQNPYIGFMSFQHFRGEKLYSDIVVKPEAMFTETERVECFPVSSDVEENGRNEGYYPDTTIVYIRTLWKEFEPRRGEYNYEFIEDILKQAKEHKQSLIFRFMAHSTRACDDVPEWLKELIPCPERPDMQRVKDSPTDPLFMQLFLEAVTKLGERFDKDPFFDAIDISLPGAWGEGHNLELYPDDLFETTVDTYAKAFPNTQLLTQISRTELIEYASRYQNVGWRGDGLGCPNHTQNIYPPLIEKVPEQWKKAPVSFESYWWLGEWKRKGWSIDEIIEKTLQWHISSFNPKSIPIPWDWQDKCDYWLSRMGYHFTINSVSLPATASKGDLVSILFKVENVGVAPAYKKMPLIVRLKNNEKIYEFEQNVDITKWIPGKHTEWLCAQLPKDIEASEYEVEIALKSIHSDIVYFATNAERDEEFYKVGKIKIN